MSVENTVLTIGPGEGIMHREKMPRIMSMRYCPSYTDQRCCRNDLKVSWTEKDVLSVVMEEEGDCRLRIFERNFRRIR